MIEQMMAVRDRLRSLANAEMSASHGASRTEKSVHRANSRAFDLAADLIDEKLAEAVDYAVYTLHKEDGAMTYVGMVTIGPDDTAATAAVKRVVQVHGRNTGLKIHIDHQYPDLKLARNRQMELYRKMHETAA